MLSTKSFVSRAGFLRKLRIFSTEFLRPKEAGVHMYYINFTFICKQNAIHTLLYKNKPY